MANLWLGIGITGTAVLAGGLIWYFMQPLTQPTQTGRAGLVQPWVGRSSGGLLLGSAF
jgi:hypothetical protein